MGIEDTWYGYYRGPSSQTFTEKLQFQPMQLPTTCGHQRCSRDEPIRSPGPSIQQQVMHAESDRRAEIRAKHQREREIVAITLDLLCQIAAFTCAIVFGIWAVKSYNVEVAALKVQTIANHLSLRSLCTESALANDPKCRKILGLTVEGIMDPDLFQDSMAGTELVVPKLSLGAIVGIVIGSVAAFLFMNITLAIWRRRKMIMQLNSRVGTDYSSLEAGHPFHATNPLHTVSESGSSLNVKKFSNYKRECKKSTNSSMVSVSTNMSGSTYSGNPLTPNGPQRKLSYVQ